MESLIWLTAFFPREDTSSLLLLHDFANGLTYKNTTPRTYESLKLTAEAQVQTRHARERMNLLYCPHAANEKLISGCGGESWSRRSLAPVR
jgi:hypothetical protein